MRKVRVKGPDLKSESSNGEISPQVTLDRHQTRSVRFFLQLTPSIGMVIAIEILFPCRGKVNQAICLARCAEHTKVEIGIELSSRFKFGAGQTKWSRTVSRSQHPLHFRS